MVKKEPMCDLIGRAAESQMDLITGAAEAIVKGFSGVLGCIAHGCSDALKGYFVERPDGDKYFRTSAAEPISSDREIHCWTPPVDIDEDDEAYWIKVELPGLKKEDIKVMPPSEGQRVLTIMGERKQSEKERSKSHHRSERSYGRFRRRFVVPKHVDAKRVSAKYDEGILLVRLQKRETAKPIPIRGR